MIPPFLSPVEHIARVKRSKELALDQRRLLARRVLFDLGTAIGTWEATAGEDYIFPIYRRERVEIEGLFYTQHVRTELRVDYRRRRLALGQITVNACAKGVNVTVPKPRNQSWGNDPEFIIRVCQDNCVNGN